jgi:hypothetical protein
MFRFILVIILLTAIGSAWMTKDKTAQSCIEQYIQCKNQCSESCNKCHQEFGECGE